MTSWGADAVTSMLLRMGDIPGFVVDALAPSLKWDVGEWTTCRATRSVGCESMSRGSELLYFAAPTVRTSPIEPMWSKVSRRFERWKRERDVLPGAVDDGLAVDPAGDCGRVLSHCGYTLRSDQNSSREHGVISISSENPGLARQTAPLRQRDRDLSDKSRREEKQSVLSGWRQIAANASCSNLRRCCSSVFRAFSTFLDL